MSNVKSQKRSWVSIVVLGLVIIVVGLVGLAYVLGGQLFSSNEGLSATLFDIVGLVETRPDPSSAWQPGQEGQLLWVGSEVSTGLDGRARINLTTGTTVRVASNTIFSFTAMEQTNQGLITRLRLGFGQVWIILNGGSFEIDTPSGVASVRGSYMSVSIDPQTGEAFVTCLEGNCVVQTNAVVLELIAGQTAAVSNSNSLPTPGVLSDQMISEWLAVNPEATVIIPAVTATVHAAAVNVQLPTLACFDNNSCALYCAPTGWNPLSGELPNLDDIPIGCAQAASSLVWQGVDPVEFMACVLIGGNAQTCANDSVNLVTPLAGNTPLVTLPPLACLETDSCATYCAPPGWDPSSNTIPPVENIPSDCLQAAQVLLEQGVNPGLFLRCVFTYGDVQGCADASVTLLP